MAQKPPKKPNYRYTVQLDIKSTNKQEVIEELETMLLHFKSPHTVGCYMFGDSGTCMAESTVSHR